MVQRVGSNFGALGVNYTAFSALSSAEATESICSCTSLFKMSLKHHAAIQLFDHESVEKPCAAFKVAVIQYPTVSSHSSCNPWNVLL